MPKVIPGYKEDAKRTIIQAAIDVIAERRFALTTIEEIATRLGVSKGAVYWYFPNKDALIKDVYQNIEDDFKRIHYTKYYNQSIEQFYRLYSGKHLISGGIPLVAGISPVLSKSPVPGARSIRVQHRHESSPPQMSSCIL